MRMKFDIAVIFLLFFIPMPDLKIFVWFLTIRYANVIMVGKLA